MDSRPTAACVSSCWKHDVEALALAPRPLEFVEVHQGAGWADSRSHADTPRESKTMTNENERDDAPDTDPSPPPQCGQAMCGDPESRCAELDEEEND